jgi:hypothetical protein
MPIQVIGQDAQYVNLNIHACPRGRCDYLLQLYVRQAWKKKQESDGSVGRVVLCGSHDVDHRKQYFYYIKWDEAYR